MSLAQVTETLSVPRQQLLEVLMNVPFPLTVLHGPSHIVALSNRAQLSEVEGRVQFGQTFATAFPDLAERVVPILDRVYREGIPAYEKEIAVGDRFVNSSYIPFRAEDGRVEGVIVSTLDITAEVLGREAAANQGKWLEFVLDLIPVPTSLVRPGSGEVLMVNAAARRQVALFPEDPNSAKQSDCYFTDLAGSRLAQHDWPRFRAARGEELYGLQLVWNCPDRKIPLVVESRRLPQAYGHPAVVALHYHDVSDLKQAESALRESVADLQRERELRERFVTTLTHDLRNPLTAAKLTAQTMARENPDSKKIGDLSGRICGSINRADQMVRDLLDANRLKAGEEFPLRIGNHCLNEIAQDCLDGLSVLHGSRFLLQAKTQIRGRWCRSSLKRVFENLCGNAAKYGSYGAPVTVSLEEENDRVFIGVHNFGNPIPRSEQPGIFQPYHRTRTAEFGQQRGWGLGLALVRGITEAHGGKVSLDYSDERGTRFLVELPRITRPRPSNHHENEP